MKAKFRNLFIIFIFFYGYNIIFLSYFFLGGFFLNLLDVLFLSSMVVIVSCFLAVLYLDIMKNQGAE